MTDASISELPSYLTYLILQRDKMMDAGFPDLPRFFNFLEFDVQ
jgi:hypothetical protein